MGQNKSELAAGARGLNEEGLTRSHTSALCPACQYRTDHYIAAFTQLKVE